MPVKLMCTGDFMAGENVHHYRRGIPTRFKNRYEKLITDDVRKIIGMSDLLLVNFEASLVADNQAGSLPIERGVYAAPVESLNLLKSLDTEIIANVANNHFGQHGTEAADFTVDELTRSGILVTGRDKSPLTLNRQGLKISIWGCSLVKDSHYHGSYLKSSYESLLSDLELPVKQSGDIWILSIHWGDEYHTRQNDAQEKLAEKLSAAGFDYIIGHHPHVIQPVSKVGNAWVFYSHGNFIFDQNFSGLTSQGLVSLINLEDKNVSLYFSRQKKFIVEELVPVADSRVEEFCKAHDHPKKPFIMRILMKLELLYRFYELNPSIIRTFTGRLFRK